MNVNRLNRFLDGARPRWERSPLRLCRDFQEAEPLGGRSQPESGNERTSNEKC